jgi:hydrogenase nickel incorporation protein HypA/HybF
MHEFSLATDIIEIVEQSVRQNDKKKVLKVELEIGILSGVEIPALETALEALIENTLLSEAVFEKKIVPGLAHCNDCKTDFQLSDVFSLCPNCQGYNKSILKGKEFNVLSIEAE